MIYYDEGYPIIIVEGKDRIPMWAWRLEVSKISAKWGMMVVWVNPDIEKYMAQYPRKDILYTCTRPRKGRWGDLVTGKGKEESHDQRSEWRNKNGTYFRPMIERLPTAEELLMIKVSGP